MKTENKRSIHLTMLAGLLLVVLAALLIMPQAAHAKDGTKTVRVGWYESPFNTIDQSGRRSGYAYEYQRKIAAYTGWDYQYVSGSWPDLYQMLVDGEIDLMGDVSYTEERAEDILFSTLPMGTEGYYIFIAPGNEEITPDDLSSFSGKRIGVSKGTVQEDFYREWAEENGVSAELAELNCLEAEAVQMLQSGKIDAYITLDGYGDPSALVPVCKIGASDFYFAVNKDRPDLLDELNMALNRIHEEDRNYNQQLYEKYLVSSGTNAFLTSEESRWLEKHGLIRVGYQDQYLSFCAKDETTGQLNGALKDYLDFAEDCMANAHLEFETIAYPTVSAAIEALKSGEVDCVFPSNLAGYDSERLGLVITPSMMRTDTYAVIRSTDQTFFRNHEHVIVAVNQGNPNYDSFLLDNFPGWRAVTYSDTQECLKAISEGVADCVLISNFRYNNIKRLCDQYHLVAISTGIILDYGFAVAAGNTELYSIMAKTTGLVPNSTVNAALSYYNAEDVKLTFTDYVKDHLPVFMAIVAAIIAVILFFMIRSIRAEKKAKDLIAATETDGLTGLYSRNYFFEYASRMCREHPETPMDAFVMNIEHFHSLNAFYGRDFGDRVLSVLANEIRMIADELGGIAGRFEADHFDIYCCHTDSYQEIYERLQKRLDSLGPDAGVQLRMGVMPWQEGLEPVQQFDQARTACSLSRGHFKEHLTIFDDTIRDRENYEQLLISDLNRALDAYEFEVYYQPKYDIQSDPPRLVSAEALVRWNHPTLGMILPNDFVPLFERNGKIVEVDKYVWGEAARQVVRWRAQYGVTIPVSVNLSRVDLLDPGLTESLDAILRYYGLDHNALKLEVTETAYTGHAGQVMQVVEELRSKGYVVEMDDFGTGYSSLNMLSAMPVDVLKMDRAFIRNIENNDKDLQLVSLIIGTAKTLKIPVVAEGVETESQMKLLRELGCPVVQGYYFSKPLHPSEFESEIIRNNTGE